MLNDALMCVYHIIKNKQTTAITGQIICVMNQGLWFI